MFYQSALGTTREGGR